MCRLLAFATFRCLRSLSQNRGTRWVLSRTATACGFVSCRPASSRPSFTGGSTHAFGDVTTEESTQGQCLQRGTGFPRARQPVLLPKTEAGSRISATSRGNRETYRDFGTGISCRDVHEQWKIRGFTGERPTGKNFRRGVCWRGRHWRVGRRRCLVASTAPPSSYEREGCSCRPAC